MLDCFWTPRACVPIYLQCAQSICVMLFLIGCLLPLVVKARANDRCIPDRIYCGYQLDGKYLVIPADLEDLEEDPDNSLFLCTPGGYKASFINFCYNGCGQLGPGEGSRCLCIPDKKYCGHQLVDLGWIELGKQWLYKCNDGATVSLIERCEGHSYCVTDPYVDPKCSGACKAGYVYCGFKLNAFGWNEYENNTLYLCNSDGTNVSMRTACPGTCLHSSRGSGRCACTPGKIYCARELHAMGWNGHLDLGRFLSTRDNRAQYYCMNGRTIIKMDGNITCGSPCTPGRSYCGHELAEDWYIETSEYKNRFVCTPKGKIATATYCDRCISNGVNAYCPCQEGLLYCGSEVYNTGKGGLGYTEPPLDFTNDTIYSCSAGRIESVQACETNKCSNSAAWYQVYCRCTHGKSYCGHSLAQGDTTYYVQLPHSHSIYLCIPDTPHAIEQTRCKECIADEPPRCQERCSVNRHYCGSRLIKQEGWDEHNLEPDVLYNCTNGTDVTRLHSCQAGCEDVDGSSAYCKLLPTAWYWILMAVVLPLTFIALSSLFIRTWMKHRRLRILMRQRRIDSNQLVLRQKLGAGQFGEVWSGTLRDVKGRTHEVALKMSKHRVSSGTVPRAAMRPPRGSVPVGVPGLTSADCFFQEIVALQFLRHKNIIYAFGICSNFKDTEGTTAPALVLEYMNGGNAGDYVMEERKRLSHWDLVHIFVDICQAGVHLCKMGVVHRDIGACNVLVRKHPKTSKPMIAKLNDFGLAKDIGKLRGLYKAINPDRAICPTRHTAPEGLLGRFSSKSDVWSFGVFMWELYMIMDEALDTEPIPYSQVREKDVAKEIFRGIKLQRPAPAPDDIYETMESCWSFYPGSRPSFAELLIILQSVTIHVPSPLVQSQSDHREDIAQANPQPEPNPTVTVDYELTEQATVSARGYGSPDIAVTALIENMGPTGSELPAAVQVVPSASTLEGPPTAKA